MVLTLIDSNKNVAAEFKVELDRHMFIIAPKILDDDFLYLNNKLMKLRSKYMTKYLYYIEYDKSKQEANNMELEIIEEIKEILEEEIKYKFLTEGKEYFIINDLERE